MELIPRRVVGILTVLLCCAEAGFGAPATLHFREPSRRSYQIQSPPDAQRSRDPLWLPATEMGSIPRKVLFSHRLVLKLKPGAELKPLLKRYGLKIDRLVKDDLLILAAADAMSAAATANELAGNSNVVACYPIMRKEVEPDGAYAPRPNDQYFMLQAYHEFRDEDGTAVGADINTRAAWPYTTGEGVTLAVADTGVQLTHPDISNQAGTGEHHNFASDLDEGTPAALNANWVHGTSVAGLALAQGNNSVGMIGVAPGARLASWVIYDTNLLQVGDDKLMEMYTRHEDVVWVQNHSWGKGNRDDLYGPTLLEQAGITEAIENGRGGKGVIMVRAGGNYRMQGRNVSEDLYAEDPRVIAVGAVNNAGRATTYSSPGAPLLISAPGGEITGAPPFMFTLDFVGADGATPYQFYLPTDPDNTMNLWDYRYDFNPFAGTSASAPLISGVCALMLSANPNLTYRDVQHILALSARHLDTADPDLHTNTAGFLISHNQGFGIVDAGQAVQLAKGWINRPPALWITNMVDVNQFIADDTLRVTITDAAGTTTLADIHSLPSLGVQPDDPLPLANIVDVGLANTPIADDLTGKAALIERGGSDYSVKIQNAADAGAIFAVIYNNSAGTAGCPGGDQLCPLGGTDYVPIPAVFIGQSDGQTIQNLLAQDSNIQARLSQSPLETAFHVTDTFLLEHVGLRLMTDHPLRGDLRITLTSPGGTRSILQRYNADTNAGPVDWTYYSTHDFYESSVGDWTLEVTDEGAGSVGSVLQAGLVLQGVPITDTDADGLDDNWEIANFQNLAQGPADDPDQDGYSNAREQVMHTDPNVAEIPFRVDPATWNARLVRLSWPGVKGVSYEIRSGANVTSLQPVTNVTGVFPETVWFTTYTNLQQEFFQIRRLP